MKVYLSALETNPDVDKYFTRYDYMLFSFYYLRQSFFDQVKDKCDSILIDSGAHSFQRGGVKVKWDEYTHQYAEWIKQNDRDNIIGYFEMDIDRVVGYDKVLQLRNVLESVSDKIIPVWHKNRGIADYKAMCEKYSGKWIAITGFKNEDIKDEQYMMFLKYAKKFGCKVHCLGMTRTRILDKVPFDSVDSSSWKQSAIYGRVGDKKVKKEYSKTNRTDVMVSALHEAMKMQKHYRKKWIANE